jgi:putative transposase
MRQCELLDVCRSSLYYQAKPVSPCDLGLMRRIDELHLAHPFLGARRLARMLQREGLKVGRDHVGTLMRVMGIEAIYRRKRTTMPQKGHKIYPYLLGNLAIERPNQAWAADITYLPMAKGFAYLIAILDLYSRKVLSFRVSNAMTSEFCVEALQEALRGYGVPEIFNTDSKNARASCRTIRTASPFTVMGRSDLAPQDAPGSLTRTPIDRRPCLSLDPSAIRAPLAARLRLADACDPRRA